MRKGQGKALALRRRKAPPKRAHLRGTTPRKSKAFLAAVPSRPLSRPFRRCACPRTPKRFPAKSSKAFISLVPSRPLSHPFRRCACPRKTRLPPPHKKSPEALPGTFYAVFAAGEKHRLPFFSHFGYLPLPVSWWCENQPDQLCFNSTSSLTSTWDVTILHGWNFSS